MWSAARDGVAGDVTDTPDKLTTDPPRPPGTPDVDDLGGDPVPTADGPRKSPDEGPGEASGREVPEDEDVASDTVSVEPPD